jgi:hypothetical protein
MGEISGLRKVCFNRHCSAEIRYVNLCCISIARKWLAYIVTLRRCVLRKDIAGGKEAEGV